MFTLPGIVVKALIYESAHSAVYRALWEETHQPLILKLLKEDYPTPQKLERYRTEYTITQSLEVPGVIKAYDLQRYQNTLVMLLEDFGGESLKIWLQQRPFSLDEFLRIAIATTQTLEQIHAAHIIHKDINPSNIIFNLDSYETKIIDFGIATQLTRENPPFKSPTVLEGTLAYISPEQTGRMNRSIDYRSDFYSLGITFYELLTQKLPFDTTDALELVHCHIAKEPIPPISIQPQIPPIVSDIVMKLIAKTAEERYQSALGLQYDLEQCLMQYQDTGTIAPFPLGQRDVCDHFLIPERLYGRETEVETLLQAFERVADGTAEMVLVAGFSGIGKTAVVHEVHKPITRQHGYFIQGKFDQFNRGIPFSAFVQALRSLIRQVLSESNDRLAHWKNRILTALGESGQVLIEVMPELERVIGKQPPVPMLAGAAAQNRFNLLFQKFIEVFTTPDQPLVIFLDDLQWVDLASLQLIKLLMEEKAYLLLLGAYRDNEVSSVHPFMAAMAELQTMHKAVQTIALLPLAFDDINQLVADTLHCATERSRPLTELINRKAQGNPFFTTQFLKALHEDGYLTFNRQFGYWECDIAQVSTLSLTEDVVELMAQQLQKLPAKTQHLLQLAACLGNQFELATLAIAADLPETTVMEALWQALQDGLIIPQSEVYQFSLESIHTETANDTANETIERLAYRFLHDRVQQAAYSLIPISQHAITHYRIGELLFSHTESVIQEESIFELVEQLNYGTEFIHDQHQRDTLAQLNLIACRKARAATAYAAGREYARTGLIWLGEAGWQRQYDMTLAFHDLAAELALLCGDFADMEHWTQVVIQQAQSLLEKVNAYQTRIQANTSQNKLTDAIAIAQQLLRELQVTFPPNPTQDDVHNAIREIEILLGSQEVQALLGPPRMADPQQIAIIQIATGIMVAAYLSGSPLYALLVSLCVKLSIQYGNAPMSPVGYAAYGFVACSLLQNIPFGTQFGHLALQLTTDPEYKAFRADVILRAGLFIVHRNTHLKQTLPLLKEGYAVGLELGNQVMTGYNAHAFCLNAFWCGQPLATLATEAQAYTAGLIQLNQLTTANYCRIYWQAMLNLIQSTDRPDRLDGEVLHEDEFLPGLVAAHDLSGLYYFHVFKLMLAYWFGNIEAAQAYATQARRYLSSGVAGTVSEAVFYFYDSLTAIATLSQHPEHHTDLLQRIEANQQQLRQDWARHAPMNYQHKLDLVEAEKCRILGLQGEAIDRYDQAIARAKAHGYIQEEGLANELAARFYGHKGKRLIARAYIQEARYCYRVWGAIAKVKHLEEQYSDLITTNQRQSSGITTLSQDTLVGNANLDIATVMKASQAISGEIVLDRLLSTLMQILLESAGAQRGYLILAEQGQLRIEAEGTIDQDDSTTCVRSLVVAACPDLSQAIVNYVARTRESVVLNDALYEGSFINDPYIQTHKPKSILCVPLLNQGKLISIVYLENNRTAGAFTQQRVELLQLLSGQAAISIQNSKLYTEVRQNESRLAQLNRAYERFVPSQFLQFLDKPTIVEVALGDHIQLELSVLFSDIRDFTVMSEQMTPEDNFRFINSYLSRMEPTIAQNHGFIDKYIGDAVMALFSGEADNAVKAGLGMLHQLELYNRDRERSHQPPIRIGIGINTGSLMLGTVGGQSRMEGTVISDAVNVASRVETLTKNYGVALLITHETYSRLVRPDDYAIRNIDTVKVKGKSQSVTVYEIFDADPIELREGKLNTLPQFTEALALYTDQQWAAAATLLAECVRQNPGDRVAHIYLERCHRQDAGFGE